MIKLDLTRAMWLSLFLECGRHELAAIVLRIWFYFSEPSTNLKQRHSIKVAKEV